MNAIETARIFGCTVEQAKAQYLRNSVQMQKMADKAKATGRKVNGATADVWQAKADQFAALAK